MKKILALTLSLLLLLSLFAGCGGSAESSDTETEAAASTEAAPVTIVGTWKYTLNYLSLFEAMLQDAADSGSRTYFLTALYDGLSEIVVLDLKEDGTFTMNVDEATAADNRTQLKERLDIELPDLIASSMGTTAEDLKALLAEEGASFDDLVAQYREELDIEGMLSSSMIDPISGTYAYDDGCLYLMSENESTVTYTVELGGSELKILDIMNDTSSALDGLLPLVFVR